MCYQTHRADAFCRPKLTDAMSVRARPDVLLLWTSLCFLVSSGSYSGWNDCVGVGGFEDEVIVSMRDDWMKYVVCLNGCVSFLLHLSLSYYRCAQYYEGPLQLMIIKDLGKCFCLY